MPFDNPLAAEGNPDALRNVESFRAPPERISPDIHSQLTNPQDIASANQFFKPSSGSQFLPGSDIGAQHIDITPIGSQPKFAVPHMTGLETQGVQLPAGGDVSGLAAAQGLPGAMPGAEQISPLINMIMKMPGHIGLVGSFFEALGAFFAPAAEMAGHLAGGLDLSAMFEHAGAASEALGHGLESSLDAAGGHVDLSLLPGDAPIFDQIGHPAGAEHFGLHGLPGAGHDLNFTASGLDFNPSQHLRDSFASANRLEVGGGPNGQMFEMSPHGQGLDFGPANNHYVAMEPSQGFGGTVGQFNTPTPVQQPTVSVPQSNYNGPDFGRDVTAPEAHSINTVEHSATTGGDATQSSSADRVQEAGQAAAPEKVSYTVHNGDNLWDIAKNQLGDGTRWEEIYHLNQNILGDNPRLIMPGTELQMPGGDMAVTAGGAQADYIVQSGDNLWDISRDHLGGGQNWHELYQQNQAIVGGNPDMIHPGQHLQLDGGDHGNQMHHAGQQLASNHHAAHPQPHSHAQGQQSHLAHHSQSGASSHTQPASAPDKTAINSTGELKAEAKSLSSS